MDTEARSSEPRYSEIGDIKIHPNFERKFLIKPKEQWAVEIAQEFSATESLEITQGFFNGIRFRKTVKQGEPKPLYETSVKMNIGKHPVEQEEIISEEKFSSFLQTLNGKELIKKTRHPVPLKRPSAKGNHIFDFTYYHDRLGGSSEIEIEFMTQEEMDAFNPGDYPTVLNREITSEISNSELFDGKHFPKK